MLDFVQPVRAGGRLRSRRGEARRNKARRQGTRTQRHGVRLGRALQIWARGEPGGGLGAIPIELAEVQSNVRVLHYAEPKSLDVM